METFIELHINGEWLRAAEIVHVGEYRATFEYLPEYVFGETQAPVSIAIPPTMDRTGFAEDGDAPACPAFMFDLVPQGLGRKYLLQQLRMADTNASDLPLAMHGAFNPIGNIRLTSAVDYFNQWREKNPDDTAHGFTIDEIVNRSDEFVEHIWLHAMLAAGTTGVQGAAPKFLLTQNTEGMWFADAALPDNQSVKHWIVKRPRGRHPDDITILYNEAAYHAVAGKCGLRATGNCFVRGNMLFFERFDRAVENGAVTRLHQESILSAAGVPGFPAGVSNFTFADAISRHATFKAKELAEFIGRDILNRAMKNTDNHGRNTSIQILQDGTVQLTPIYDFSPMFMDPEMIPRSCRWSIDGREIHDLNEILYAINAADDVKQAILQVLSPFAENLQKLAGVMDECGVEKKIIKACEASIEAQVKFLEGVTHG